LVGLRVEVDHVAGLARGLRAGIHGLTPGPPSATARSAGGIVGAIAAHGDELAFGLLVADELELVLGPLPARGKSSTPASAAIAAAVVGYRPVIMSVADAPLRRRLGEALPDAAP